ncbi:hypothetical protein MCOR27_003806 [Pyricularia oryzae]|uniref:Uncharacterized protein n=2 Tax=Pyricularia TaxID=48558 RepID=A0ABQ8NS34_PYRGI|nr:hypothetical protein MCOR01_008557 [Pyricularia oryzae]KAI6301256.1 hypothetical protein MCOR33_003203 [Pyricularia grisea]KAH9439200.1 hypothetical protein MCOR02_002770 [Pyricularia oryzae]KAI6259039.1 hypothetical protein MCOR19_004599 [Pyricularia oryzae]KAI6282406.1 hypothetical protein MCOR27_003806 [Pyricularia oryzae]
MAAAVGNLATAIAASSFTPSAGLALPSESIRAGLGHNSTVDEGAASNTDPASPASSFKPVSLRFVPSNSTLNSNLKKDNYGVLRAYPQPFTRAVNQIRDISTHITTDWAHADLSNYSNLPPNTPPRGRIPIDQPTCFVVRSGSVTESNMEPRTFNCTQACSDPRLLFEPTTFATCMQLATASLWIADNRTKMDPADEYSRKLSETLSFKSDLTDFNGSSVIQNMVSCSVAACRNKGKGACSDEIMDLKDITVRTDNLLQIATALARYCDHADSVVNEDIAGPGVLMSYIFQTGIALLFFGLAKLLSSVMRPIFFTKAWINKDTRKNAFKLSREMQRTLSLTRGNAAVISSMIEFQEVQGFFVAAIQVATLVTFRSTDGPDLGSVTSLGSILFNSGLVQVLAVSGVLPVLLVQCCLQRSGMRWWYTLAISSLVFILGMTVDIRGGYMLPAFQRVFDHFRQTQGVSECGGNPSPLVYCTGDLRFAISDDLGQNISYWVYPSLLIEQLSWWGWRRYAMEIKARRWEKRRPWARLFRRRLWPGIWFLYWVALQVVLVVFTAMYFYNIFLLVAETTLLNDQRWTYGQLVALMVWAPILGKYLYFNIFGIEEGFSRRLAKHYKVVHQDYPDSEDEEVHESDDDDDNVEQGIELKITPQQSSTTLPGVPSPLGTASGRDLGATSRPPSERSMSSRHSIRSQPSPSPLGPPTGSTAVATPTTSAPLGTVPQDSDRNHPFLEGFGQDNITMVGGIPMIVEDHAPFDRPRGDV